MSFSRGEADNRTELGPTDPQKSYSQPPTSALNPPHELQPTAHTTRSHIFHDGRSAPFKFPPVPPLITATQTPQIADSSISMQMTSTSLPGLNNPQHASYVQTQTSSSVSTPLQAPFEFAPNLNSGSQASVMSSPQHSETSSQQLDKLTQGVTRRIRDLSLHPSKPATAAVGLTSPPPNNDMMGLDGADQIDLRPLPIELGVDQSPTSHPGSHLAAMSSHSFTPSQNSSLMPVLRKAPSSAVFVDPPPSKRPHNNHTSSINNQPQISLQSGDVDGGGSNADFSPQAVSQVTSTDFSRPTVAAEHSELWIDQNQRKLRQKLPSDAQPSALAGGSGDMIALSHPVLASGFPTSTSNLTSCSENGVLSPGGSDTHSVQSPLLPPPIVNYTRQQQQQQQQQQQRTSQLQPQLDVLPTSSLLATSSISSAIDGPAPSISSTTSNPIRGPAVQVVGLAAPRPLVMGNSAMLTLPGRLSTSSLVTSPTRKPTPGSSSRTSLNTTPHSIVLSPHPLAFGPSAGMGGGDMMAPHHIIPVASGNQPPGVNAAQPASPTHTSLTGSSSHFNSGGAALRVSYNSLASGTGGNTSGHLLMNAHTGTAAHAGPILSTAVINSGGGGSLDNNSGLLRTASSLCDNIDIGMLQSSSFASINTAGGITDGSSNMQSSSSGLQFSTAISFTNHHPTSILTGAVNLPPAAATTIALGGGGGGGHLPPSSSFAFSHTSSTQGKLGHPNSNNALLGSLMNAPTVAAPGGGPGGINNSLNAVTAMNGGAGSSRLPSQYRSNHHLSSPSIGAPAGGSLFTSSSFSSQGTNKSNGPNLQHNAIITPNGLHSFVPALSGVVPSNERQSSAAGSNLSAGTATTTSALIGSSDHPLNAVTAAAAGRQIGMTGSSIGLNGLGMLGGGGVGSGGPLQKSVSTLSGVNLTSGGNASNTNLPMDYNSLHPTNDILMHSSSNVGGSDVIFHRRGFSGQLGGGQQSTVSSTTSSVGLGGGGITIGMYGVPNGGGAGGGGGLLHSSPAVSGTAPSVISNGGFNAGGISTTLLPNNAPLNATMNNNASATDSSTLPQNGIHIHSHGGSSTFVSRGAAHAYHTIHFNPTSSSVLNPHPGFSSSTVNSSTLGTPGGGGGAAAGPSAVPGSHLPPTSTSNVLSKVPNSALSFVPGRHATLPVALSVVPQRPGSNLPSGPTALSSMPPSSAVGVSPSELIRSGGTVAKPSSIRGSSAGGKVSLGPATNASPALINHYTNVSTIPLGITDCNPSEQQQQQHAFFVANATSSNHPHPAAQTPSVVTTTTATATATTSSTPATASTRPRAHFTIHRRHGSQPTLPYPTATSSHQLFHQQDQHQPPPHHHPIQQFAEQQQHMPPSPTQQQQQQQQQPVTTTTTTMAGGSGESSSSALQDLTNTDGGSSTTPLDQELDEREQRRLQREARALQQQQQHMPPSVPSAPPGGGSALHRLPAFGRSRNINTSGQSDETMERLRQDKKQKEKLRSKKSKGGCKCSKSQCLKRYCMCFAQGRLCTDECECASDCLNCENHQDREAAQHAQQVRDTATIKPANEHNTTCNCLRSSCLKNYCACYLNGFACLPSCKCIDCKNNRDYWFKPQDDMM